VHPVERLDRLVHEVLEMLPHRLDADDRRAVLVELRHGLPR